MVYVVETKGRKALRLTPPSEVSYGLPRFVCGTTALPLKPDTGGALSPLSATLFRFALVCSLCASFAAGQPLEKRVLMECQTRFYEVVAVEDIYRELCQKLVISQTVADQITKSHSVEKARGHLFDHMRDYGTLDTLKVFCDVITSQKYNGIQAMQDFGAKVKSRLEQEGRCVVVGGWVGGCVCVCVCVCVYAAPFLTPTLCKCLQSSCVVYMDVASLVAQG